MIRVLVRRSKSVLSLEFERFSSTALIIVHVSSVISPIVSPEAFLEMLFRIQLTARFSARFEIQIIYLRGAPFSQIGSLLLLSSGEPKSVSL